MDLYDPSTYPATGPMSALRDVDPDYSLTLFINGFGAAAIAGLWREGIPVEYAVEAFPRVDGGTRGLVG
jgi:hypothetical protein